jgi:hypothetical protein
MTIARNIDRGVLVVLIAALALPAVTRANPVLSGYGGPGQGSQALLGSTLVGGSQQRGGGGGGSAGTGASSGTEAGSVSVRSIEQPPARVTTNQSAPAGKELPTPPSHGSSHHAATAPRSGGQAGGSGAVAPVALVPKSSVHTDVAGLSGGDLALIVAAFAVILSTGALTARLARADGGERGDA